MAGASPHQVRRLQPDDAPGVAALVRRVYGVTYIHTELYDPDELRRHNEAGTLVSAVAVDGAGQVVGHYALERPDLGPVAETGMGMVLPEHRGHRLFGRLRSLLEDEALRLGLFGLCGRPTTGHVRSQKVYQEFNCQPTGVELARASGVVNDMTPQATQPISLVMYFKFLAAPPLAIYHLPERHQDLARRIAERLGRQLAFAAGAPLTGPGELTAHHEASARAGLIAVPQIGSDSAAAVERAQNDLTRQGAAAIFLRLPLAQRGAAELCAAVERQGFFFSGIDPRPAPVGDVLQLQQLHVPLDADALHVDEPFARDIVAYAMAERQRVGR